MGFAPEGMKLIYTGAAAAVVGCVASFWMKWAGIPLIVLGVFFALFSAFFFRDPTRDKDFAPGEIVCPADGTVLSVKTESDPGVIVVRIFLSIFNVHIQRSPLEGKVESVTYTKGRFHTAYKPEASDNERNLIRIKGESGRFVNVEQITGSIARRIAAYVKAGDEVRAGGKIGMIYFGSQVAVYLPKDSRILVNAGDKVYGAESILGHWAR